ncbi:hypothetical protein AB0M22_09270 [Nocardia sp. NPDC051756]|uniref:hypothetical protein n=1 Tax=Nocardia sp. NPDC051756 TaxID=3154751 RepID=UPI00342A7A04
MSDIRDEIAEVLYKRGAYCGDCDYETRRCRECDRVLEGYADAILAEFLVIPHSDLLGTRYGCEWTHEGQLRRDHAHSEGRAVALALEMRAQQRKKGQPVTAVPVSAPIPPWTELPLPGARCPSIEINGAHAWQADVDTPPGVVGCAVCPATTTWPLPEDGDQ